MKRLMLATLIIAALLVLVLTALAPPIIFPKPVEQSNLIAFWRFDESGNGNRQAVVFRYLHQPEFFVDSSLNNGGILTNLGSPNPSVVGKITNAVEFYIDPLDAGLVNGWWAGTNSGPVNLMMTNHTYTIAGWFWIYDDGMGLAPPYGLFGKFDADGEGGEYGISVRADNKAEFTHFANNGFGTDTQYYVTSTGTVNANDWNFIVATYNLATSTMAISLNNATFNTTVNVASNWSKYTPLTCGYFNSVLDYVTASSCKQDETGIWIDYAFTQADVNFMWNETLGRKLDPSTAIRNHVGRFK